MTATEIVFPDSGCFGCSQSNSSGLGLRFFHEGDAVFCRHVVGGRFSGSPGVVHGGILATIIDEVSCAAVMAMEGAHVVTGELTVRYEAPCPTGAEIEVRAIVADRRPKYLVVESEVRLANRPIARSTGRFFPIGRHVA
jgi:uncharacterized protein (TIGR00369 family)